MINNNRDFDAAKKIEQDVSYCISSYFNLTAINMRDEYSPFDFIFSEQINNLQVVAAIVEFRHRPTTSIGRYDALTISKIKIDKLIKWGNYMKIPPVLIVLWKDTGLMWCKLREGYNVVEQTRKTKERESDRAEQLYEIPVVKFKLLMEYTAPK